MLKVDGHDVQAAARSSQAWTYLQDQPIDMLLLDTQLNGENGWEFLERIRNDILVQDLPVIVYSSITQRDVINRYLKLGVQGILVKPVAAERMNQEVERVTRVSWRSGLFEAEDLVEARIGLAPGEVSRLYRQVANEIRAAIPELSELVNNSSDETAISRLGALRSCAINVGFTRLVAVLRALTEAAASADTARVQALLDRLPAAVRQLIMQSGGDANAVDLEEGGEFIEGGQADGLGEAGSGEAETLPNQDAAKSSAA
jgi:CheY-like chemotaxis protein